MAEVDVNTLLKQYDDEIGRLNGELIRQRAGYEAQIKELTESFVQAQNAKPAGTEDSSVVDAEVVPE